MLVSRMETIHNTLNVCPLQERAKVSFGSALASLQECCQERKFGSKAKHALKDLTLHRVTHPVLGTLVRILTALLDKGALGKDEKKIFRFTYYFVAIIIEENPEQGQAVVAELERTIQNKESALQLIGYRTLGRLCAAMAYAEMLSGIGSHSQGPRQRIVYKICSPLYEVSHLHHLRIRAAFSRPRVNSSLRPYFTPASLDSGDRAHLLCPTIARVMNMTSMAASLLMSSQDMSCMYDTTKWH